MNLRRNLSIQSSTGNNIFDKYADQFEELVTAAWKVYLGQTVYSDKGYVRALIEALESIEKRRLDKPPLDREDFEQQLRLFWWEIYTAFNTNDPKSTFWGYLLRMSVFKMRDWYEKEWKTLDRELVPPDFKVETPCDMFRWVVKGTMVYPWSRLSGFERYLLYLRYDQDYSMAKIGDMLGYTRQTISNRLERAVDKLRSISYAANAESG